MCKSIGHMQRTRGKVVLENREKNIYFLKLLFYCQRVLNYYFYCQRVLNYQLCECPF
jgi:hypothetical protein